MANHKSTLKRARQTTVRTERNKFYKTRIKNITKMILSSIENNDKEKALESFKLANSYFHHCITKGVIKKGTVARKISRLHLKINSL